MRTWLDQRLPLDALGRTRCATRRVPQHRYSIWYCFGGMTLFLFASRSVQAALLLLYYRPSASEAYESVQFIMTRVPFGWLVRSIHAWSANLMVATACRAPVQRAVPSGLPSTARTHVDERRAAACC